MNMKKSLTAMAVAGAVGAPISAAQAQPEVYGRINLALANSNEDAALNQGFFQGPDNYGNDEGLGLLSIVSRFGFRGDEDLGNGMTAIYRFEFEVDATDAGLGETNMGDPDDPGATGDNDRLSWVGLAGDFGQIKVGQMWSAMYEVIGWTIVRSQEYSYSPFFYAPTGDFLGQYRPSDLIQYRYGGGGYSSDPFTFYVEGQFDGSSGGGSHGASANVGATSDNAEDLDYLQLAAQSTVGAWTFGGAYRQTMAPTGAEPSYIAGSVRWSSGPLYVGGIVGQIDPDQDVTLTNGATGSAKPVFVQLLSTYDFGGGLNGQLGWGFGDADDADSAVGGYQTDGVANDLDSALYVQLSQSLSARTSVYFEGEFDSFNEDFDAANGSGGDPQVMLFGLRHDF